MKLELSEFEKRVELGLIRKVTKDDLVLYNYTDKCTYEKAWDDYTRAARGIIFNAKTGVCVARPFQKFFNLGEMPETSLENLMTLAISHITEKVDGSLGVIYYHDEKWNVATRGSFDSEQAVKAQEMLDTKYDTTELWTGLTYLVEIIYPDNKIVVNYGDEEKLVFLAAVVTHEDFETTDLVDVGAPFPSAKFYEYTIEEMIALQKTMPKDQEGFVVKFANGMRVKIKGEEYLRIHKMISCMSPLSFWESMVNGLVNRDYIKQLPEEYRDEFEPMVANLENEYQRVWSEIIKDGDKLPFSHELWQLPFRAPSKEALKAIGLMTQDKNSGLKHPGVVFPYILGKKDAFDRYIMKVIRPTGNILKLLDEPAQ